MAKRKEALPAVPSAVAVHPAVIPLFERSSFCITALACAVFIFYLTPLFSSTASIQWDAVDVHLSAQRYFSNQLHSGHLPFWTPYIFSGFPFLADPQTGPWYPLNWPFFLAGVTPRAIEWELFLHALIACFGAYYLSLSLLKDRHAALTCALCYGLSGFFAGHSSHIGMFQTAALFPWLLLAFAAGCARNPLLYAAAAAFAAGCMILAGHFQTSLYAFAGLALFALSLVLLRIANWKRAAFLLVLIAGIAVLLSAVQTLPGLELAQHSIRANLKASAHTEGILPLKSLSTLFYPNTYGVFDDRYQGPEDVTQYYFYAGVLLLPLAAYGLGDPRLRVIAPLLALPCVWYAFGPPAGLYQIIARLPGFAGVRAPVNIWFIPALALALAASSGMRLARSRWNRSGFLALITLLIFADLFYQNSETNPLAYARTSFQDLYGKGEDLLASKVKPAIPEMSRFLSPVNTNVFGSLNHPLDAAIETTYGYNPLQLRRYAEFTAAAASNPLLWNALNVSRILYPANGSILENPRVLPRAFFAPSVEFAATFSESQLASLNPSETVLIEGTGAPRRQDSTATAQIAEYTGSHYRIVTKAAAPSWMTVAVPFYPGWRAQMDGKPFKIIPADHALIGVEVPAGDHQITLDYRSNWFAAGACLSLAGIAACIALIFISRGRARLFQNGYL